MTVRQTVATLLLFFLILGFSFNAAIGQQNPADSMMVAIKKMPDDTAKVRIVNNFLWDNIFTGIRKEFIDLGEGNITLAKKLNDYKGAGVAAKNTAAFFFYGGDYATALEYYGRSLEYATRANDDKGIADAYRNMGNIYSQRGDWKQALDYFFNALNKYESAEHTSGVIGTLDAIGIVYKSYAGKDNYERALDYFRRAAKLKKEHGNQRGLSFSYLYIGDTFFTSMEDSLSNLTDSAYEHKRKQFIQVQSDSILYYFRNAQEINKKYQDPRLTGMLSDGIGRVFFMQEEYDSAYVYYSNSLQAKEMIGNAFGIASTKTYLGDYYYVIGEKDSALISYYDALEIAKAIHSEHIERDVSRILGGMHYEKQDYKLSADFFSRFITLNDSLQNEENTRRMTQLEMQYEFDKKEREREAEAQRQRIILYFFIAGFALMVLMALIIFRSYRVKQRANRLLEDKNLEISQKNAMLNQQNEEIEAQRDEIESQRDFVIQQRDKIAQQNKNITDSIVYAKRIQQAVLPPDELIQNLLPKHFIFFKPRDIVSGDFYWATKKHNKIVITAADSTGHGVPGAFMSLLGVSFLNEIVNKLPEKEIQPHTILNKLRAKIKTSLRQTGGIKESKDGMDMALCVIDMQKGMLEFAGANNSLLLVRNNDILKYKADRMPVGVHHRDSQSFILQTVPIQKNDIFYIFSDGFPDQFGGVKGRKFMMNRFRELVFENHNKPMPEQKQIFEKTLAEWMAHKKTSSGEPYEQLDDILVIGFKF